MKDVEELKAIASRLVGVDISLNLKCRKPEYVLGRYLVLYTFIVYGGENAAKVCNVFGKDRTTAMYSVTAIKNRIDTEPKFFNKYKQIFNYYKNKSK